MRDRFYLFLLMLHFTTGCVVSEEEQTVIITGYTGASVVLPCSCAHPQSTTFIWKFAKGNQWIPVFKDEKYSGRRELFYERSPSNLSLLISDLKMNDQGYYTCLTEPNTLTYVRLEVKGCNLVQNSWTFYVTGYSGGSVVLPCSCTELLAKPEQIQWTFFIENKYKQIYPNEQIESYKNRVKLLNPNTPGNLSLHISALTTEDQGHYQCFVSSQQVVSFRLTVLHVKEKPRVNIISLTTHQPSHQTQELPPPQQSHHTPQYIYILVAVFSVVLLLAFLALSSRYGKDEVSCSDAVYVKTSSTPAHAQNDPVELPEYVNVNAKHT